MKINIFGENTEKYTLTDIINEILLCNNKDHMSKNTLNKYRQRQSPYILYPLIDLDDQSIAIHLTPQLKRSDKEDKQPFPLAKININDKSVTINRIGTTLASTHFIHRYFGIPHNSEKMWDNWYKALLNKLEHLTQHIDFDEMTETRHTVTINKTQKTIDFKWTDTVQPSDENLIRDVIADCLQHDTQYDEIHLVRERHYFVNAGSVKSTQQNTLDKLYEQANETPKRFTDKNLAKKEINRLKTLLEKQEE